MFFRFKECPVGVEPTSPAWKAGTFAARPRAHAAEGEGVEPSRLIARLFSKQLPSPIGLPFHKAAEAGIEPASRRLTVAFPYQHRTHRIKLVRTAGFEPAISCARGTRNDQAFPRPEKNAPSRNRTDTPCMASRKAATTSWAQAIANQIVKDRERKAFLRAPGRTRTDVAALRKRSLGR